MVLLLAIGAYLALQMSGGFLPVEVAFGAAGVFGIGALMAFVSAVTGENNFVVDILGEIVGFGFGLFIFGSIIAVIVLAFALN